MPVFHPCPLDPSCRYCAGSMKSNAEALDWSFLDGVYCISLESRADRFASVTAQLHKVGLCRKVLFHRPTKHPKSGFAGSWESHRAVARHALERGCTRALILEDDVLFSGRLRRKTVSSIARAVDKLPQDWTIFYLGHWPLYAYFVRPNVLSTRSACAHAYIANSSLLQWLDDHPYGSPDLEINQAIGKGLDSAFAKLAGTYALFPMVATQSASRSDNFRSDARKRRKLKHVVTRSGYREVLLSKSMRLNEIVVAALSPVFLSLHLAKRAWVGRRPQ